MRHVAKVVLSNKENQKPLWDIIFNQSLTSDELSSENGRCYIISVSDIVYKIGYSDCKGGIKNTISTYRSAGNSGKPSDRTHGVHVLIALALKSGQDVDFWYSSINPTLVTLELIDGHTASREVSVSGKHLELENITIYRSNHNQKFPPWNLQEAGVKWPDTLIKTRMRLINGKQSVKQAELGRLLEIKEIKELITIS